MGCKNTTNNVRIKSSCERPVHVTICESEALAIPKTTDCDGNESVPVHNPCVLAALDNVVSASNDVASAIRNNTAVLKAEIDELQEAVTGVVTKVIETIDDGVSITAEQNGLWTVTVDNPTDLDSLAQKIAAALDEVRVTVAGQEADFNVNVINDSITVTVDNFPVPIDYSLLLTEIRDGLVEKKDVEPVTFCAASESAKDVTVDWQVIGTDSTYQTDDYVLSTEVLSDGTGTLNTNIQGTSGGYVVGIQSDFYINGTNIFQNGVLIDFTFPKNATDLTFTVEGMDFLSGEYDDYIQVNAIDLNGNLVEIDASNYTIQNDGATALAIPNTFRGVTPTTTDGTVKSITFTIPDEIQSLTIGYGSANGDSTGSDTEITIRDMSFTVPEQGERTLVKHIVYSDDGQSIESSYVTDLNDNPVTTYEPIICGSSNDYELVPAYDYDSSQDAFGFPTPASYTPIIVKKNDDGTVEYFEADGETSHTLSGEVVYVSQTDVMNILFNQSINQQVQHANKYFQYTDTQTVSDATNIVVTFFEGTGTVNLNGGGNFDLDASKQYSTEPMQGTVVITPDAGARYHVSYYKFGA